MCYFMDVYFFTRISFADLDNFLHVRYMAYIMDTNEEERVKVFFNIVINLAIINAVVLLLN